MQRLTAGFFPDVIAIERFFNTAYPKPVIFGVWLTSNPLGFWMGRT
jgi:hypothetical protein